VDDSDVIRLLLQASLEQLGYSVATADNGTAALQAAERERFDAIILDVGMPGLDGCAVGRALRSDPNHRHAVIAMHTTMAEPDVRSGFDGYDALLPKPCAPGLLGEHVDRLMQARRGDAPVVPAAAAAGAAPLAA
jgi:CheY-like chemotaxis protein